MPKMFNNRCTDIFSGAELLDMFEAFLYRAPNIATTYEAYLDYVDRCLASRLLRGSTYDKALNKRDFGDPSFFLYKVLCFDLDEYDRRVEEQKYDSKLLRRSEVIIQRYAHA